MRKRERQSASSKCMRINRSSGAQHALGIRRCSISMHNRPKIIICIWLALVTACTDITWIVIELDLRQTAWTKVPATATHAQQNSVTDCHTAAMKNQFTVACKNQRSEFCTAKQFTFDALYLMTIITESLHLCMPMHSARNCATVLPLIWDDYRQ